MDQDSGLNISLNCKQSIDHHEITADQEAQDMHEGAIAEVIRMIKDGEIE